MSGIMASGQGVYLHCECKHIQAVRLYYSAVTCLWCGLVWLIDPGMIQKDGGKGVPTYVKVST